MRDFMTHSNKLLIGLLVILTLHACSTAKKSSTTAIPATEDVEAILKQAKNAPADKKDALLLQAAGLLNLQQRFEKSNELLIRINKTQLDVQQLDDFYLYTGEALLALDVKEVSLERLKSVSSPSNKSIDWQIRYAIAMSESYLANGNYYEAARQRIDLDDMISDADFLKQNHEKIWQALEQTSSDFLQQMITSFNDKRTNGWLEIVLLNKLWGHEPQRLLAKIEQWKARYPLHPSTIHKPETLQLATTARIYRAEKIGILLPLSGNHAVYGQLIQQGIIAAHFHAKNSHAKSPQQTNHPIDNTISPPIQINFYDTAKTSALSAYQQAVQQQADIIIGPLSKEDIEQIAPHIKAEIPQLLLNRLDDAEILPLNTFQFGLPIEDEAIQVAHRAFEKGYRKAIAFLPANSLGQRANTAFQQYFEQLGGELVDVQYYQQKKSLKQDVQKLLAVNKSISRIKALKQLLGRNIEAEERRRQDADFIFVVAEPSLGRLIKPFINYYYAHNLPVLSTSRIYSGSQNPKTDIDLNGIEFPDIPLLLSQLDEFKNARQWFKQIDVELVEQNARYFSLGYDAFSMFSQLSILRAFPGYRWNGLSGELGIDGHGVVHRYLTWAQFNRGIPNITKEREIKQATENSDLGNHLQPDLEQQP